MNFKRADWVECTFELQLSEFQKKCVELLCIAQGCGPYDFARTFETACWGKRIVEFNVNPNWLATHDANGLTKLVIGAHELSIRVEIEPRNMRYLRIILSDRAHSDAVDSPSWSHPKIEQAVEDFRRKFGGKL